MSTSATPQGITKQYKTKRDPHRRKDRIIDEPAYVDTIKSTKQIITAEKGLEIA
jgi:hypothetical protein